MRWFSIAPFSILILLLFSTLGLSFAAQKHYIVYLGKHRSEARHLAEAKLLKNPGHKIISHFLQRKPKEGAEVVYTYSKVFHGFSAILHEEDANEIAKHPRVISVIEAKTRHLATTKSWAFLGLENSNGDVSDDSLWKKSNFGEDMIIANIDTGVWPESKAFDDEGYGPIPKRFKGICDNANNSRFRCNKKLIGARYFYNGIQKDINQTIDKLFWSPRDFQGHGTHTLATAGGRAVPNVGYPQANISEGTVKGGAPRARVVAYKVCWAELAALPGFSSNMSRCHDADICAGIEAAIKDNVDLISASVGAADFQHYLNDAMAICSFHAVQKGIPVISSAGNIGPDPTTVRNSAPWMLTVAASSINRIRPIEKYVILGNNSRLEGEGLFRYPLEKRPYPLTSGVAAKSTTSKEDEALRCSPKSLNPTKVKGKLLMCLVNSFHQLKSIEGEASRVGAIGMILSIEAKDKSNGSPDFELPVVGISPQMAEIAWAYINSTSNPVAYFEEPSEGDAPLIAAFSARGPNKAGPTILKPDIAAPGVNILSANADIFGNKSWVAISGTSMSAPHVAGVVALLKSMYPDWSPSAIKSAIMTTATTVNKHNMPIRRMETTEEANPFDYGAGQIVPNKAADPGLVYDMSENDYLNFLCALKFNTTGIKKFAEHIYTCPETPSFDDFNYPSISIYPFSPKRPITISRKLKNVGKPGTYVAQVSPPPGIAVDVVPNKLNFKKTGEELSFRATFKSADGSPLPTDYVFGELVWTDGQHRVRSTITVLVDSPLLRVEEE